MKLAYSHLNPIPYMSESWMHNGHCIVKILKAEMVEKMYIIFIFLFFYNDFVLNNGERLYPLLKNLFGRIGQGVYI